MKHVFLLAASLLLVACSSMNSAQNDEPEDKVMQTGSHIPIKDKSVGKATGSADAQSMIQNQKMGSPNGAGGK
jgi:uncharacterized protein YcfL